MFIHKVYREVRILKLYIFPNVTVSQKKKNLKSLSLHNYIQIILFYLRKYQVAALTLRILFFFPFLSSYRSPVDMTLDASALRQDFNDNSSQ
jgi:hypothetical protein